MKATTEEKLIDQLNQIAEEQRKLDGRRAGVFADWVQARADLIRAGQEPGDRPLLRDGEFELIARKENLLRDRLADEPRHQQLVRNLNRQNQEDAERLSAA